MAKRKTLKEWKEELVGEIFGRLTVLDIQQHYRGDRKDGYNALCRCTCGKEVLVLVNTLISNNTKSCGCLIKEKAKENLVKAREKLKDWESKHPEEVRNNRERGMLACEKWREEHPEEVKAITKKRLACLEEWKKTHIEEVKEHNSKALEKAHLWQKEHREEFITKVRKNIKCAIQWNKDHPDKFKEHCDIGLDKAHKWIEEHPEEVREITKKRLSGYLRWRKNNLNEIVVINKIIGKKTREWRKKHSEEVRKKLLTSFSKEEKELYNFLLSLGYSVKRQYLLEDHYFDFCIEKFLIEYNGSIYHCSQYLNVDNPSSKNPPTVFKDSYYHKSLLCSAAKNGFSLIQVWDYEWINNKEFVQKLIKDQLSGIADYKDYLEDNGLLNNDFGFSLDGEQKDPRPLWISTANPKKRVDEAYTKSKVLVYNSGYTKPSL